MRIGVLLRKASGSTIRGRMEETTYLVCLEPRAKHVKHAAHLCQSVLFYGHAVVAQQVATRVGRELNDGRLRQLIYRQRLLRSVPRDFFYLGWIIAQRI